MNVLLTTKICRILLLICNLDPDPIFSLRNEEISTCLTVISGLIIASDFDLKMEGKNVSILEIMFLLTFVCLRIV